MRGLGVFLRAKILGKWPEMFDFIREERLEMFNRKVPKKREMFHQKVTIFAILDLEIARIVFAAHSAPEMVQSAFTISKKFLRTQIPKCQGPGVPGIGKGSKKT